MNYTDFSKWIKSFYRFGVKLDLDRIKYLCKKLDNPQNKYKTIHVAGTNGKGSVCRFLESVLYEDGYNVGVYTSPHIEDLTERITINKKKISKKEIVSASNIIKPFVNEMINNNDSPTFFEVFTAIAFKIFNDKNVDFAIVETGLGGRLDATNIVKPMVSVITNISLEHQNILGKNICDIAFEKAGIIKRNIPVVTAARDKSLNVIKKTSKEKKTSIKIVDRGSWEKIDGGNFFQTFKIKGEIKEYIVKTQMLGSFQGENISIAISTIEKLQMNGIYFSQESIINGIKNVNFPGRMEIISNNPTILLDGAHNISGINVLYDTIKNDFEYDKLIFVIGILSDKNIKNMLKILNELADHIVLTKSKNKRSCDPNDMKKILIDLSFKNRISIKNKVDEAIIYAKKISKKNDMICVTGSLFTVGEARKYLKK